MRCLRYDEGGDPERMEGQERDDGSHGRGCVVVAATRLLLNVRFTCGNSRQHLFDKLEILVGYKRGGRLGGVGERGRSLVKQGREVLLLLIDSCLVGQEHKGQSVSAVVGFDLTDEYSTEDEGEGHYDYTYNEASVREEVGAVV